MKKLWAVLVVAFVFGPVAVMASDDGQTQPKMNTALSNSHTTATDLIPLTNGAGNVKGILCVMADNSGSFSSPLVKFYVNGGAAQTITIDADYAEEHTVSGFIFRYSGWVPFNVRFTSSIRVTIQKPSSGGNTIQCEASWALD